MLNMLYCGHCLTRLVCNVLLRISAPVNRYFPNMKDVNGVYRDNKAMLHILNFTLLEKFFTYVWLGLSAYLAIINGIPDNVAIINGIPDKVAIINGTPGKVVIINGTLGKVAVIIGVADFSSFKTEFAALLLPGRTAGYFTIIKWGQLILAYCKMESQVT